MVSESEREKIAKEARIILGKFAQALDKVPSARKTEDKGSSYREEGKSSRSVGAGDDCDEDFRERMFDNAPKKSGDFILAEKASW